MSESEPSPVSLCESQDFTTADLKAAQQAVARACVKRLFIRLDDIAHVKDTHVAATMRLILSDYLESEDQIAQWVIDQEGY